MALSDCSDEESDTLLGVQDDTDESNENENFFEEDLTVKNDETDSGTPAIKNVKNYSKIPGVEKNEIMEWEKEIESMMESVKKIHVALSEDSKIEDVFRFHEEELANHNHTNNQDDLTDSYEKIEKMDVILKVKATEEKEAKLLRLQEEEKSRDILSRLPRGEMSNGMKLNLEEFMRLLSEVNKSDDVKDETDICKQLKEQNLISWSFSPDQKGIETDEKNEDKSKEKKEKTCNHQRKSNLKFVERNIQLAKCGRGTLSLTDEEKSRIETLLMNIQTMEETKAEKDLETKKEFYSIDMDTKSILSQIEERLEVFAKPKTLERVESKLSLLKNKVNEESGSEEEEKEIRRNGRKEGKIKPFRLKEIDKLLNSINSVSNEEISPLTEEQIITLIEESKESLEKQSFTTAEEKKDWATCRPSQEIIAELVSTAKSLMPKFKYRFDDS